MGSTDLVSYLQDRADDHLRGVLRYDENTTDVLYLREDLRGSRIQSQFDRIVRRVKPESAPEEERSFPFGDLYVTVRRFEEAILLHFPQGPARGTIVALEPDAARDLNRFTTECLRWIEE